MDVSYKIKLGSTASRKRIDEIASHSHGGIRYLADEHAMLCAHRRLALYVAMSLCGGPVDVEIVTDVEAA